MIRLLTGGGLAMPAHIQMDGPTVEDGLQTKETHTQRTHGGSTARYHWLTMCGLTKMVTPPVEFPLWKCAGLWSWHTSSCSWEERLCSAPGWAWFPTTRATSLRSWTRRPSKCPLLPFWCSSSSCSIRPGSNLPPRMWREISTRADELTHPHFTGFRPGRQLPVSEAFSHFKLLWSLLDNQPLGPNCKRRKADQKAT